ncbi:MAG: flagellar filament capping protein FliD [Desulfuromonadaceae bacterium]|nr:flagellar filament capping protein FliD [Desulfuromonadaceae bacterium]
MAITFGGLATGIDTESIITELMNIERAPIDRLENDQAYYQNRLAAFSKLDTKLKAFLDDVKAIDSASELSSPSAKVSSEEFLGATAGGNAQLGSYQISVVSLAQQQKDVSQGYADKSSLLFGTGTLNLTVGSETTEIAIDDENNSLEGIAKAINDADAGVSATIINDGTDTPYRLVLTGESVSETFSLDSSGLSGGTELPPDMETTLEAKQAHVVVDGIDVYGDSNTIDDAISGLTLELRKEDPDSQTTLTVSMDHAATESKIKDFVDGYNAIVTYIADQKTADWGSDSAFRTIKSRLQEFLVSAQGSGAYSTLSQLGFETQRDGQITLDSTRLSAALTDDYAAVVKLFAGDGVDAGITEKFTSYLEDITDYGDGIYAARKESTDSNVRRIDLRITSLEARMEQKEDALRAQFSAMEELVSGLNSQGTYLLQQLSNLSSTG